MKRQGPGAPKKVYAKGTEPKRKMFYSQANILKAVARAATKAGVSQNAYINNAITEKLEADGIKINSRYTEEL